jgi:Tfp pilus assembly protein PilN
MRINLLPPEVGERQRMRRRTLLVGIIGLVVLLGVVAFYFLQVIRLSGTEDDIAAQEAENAELQRQIDELSDIAALEQEIAATRDLLAQLLEDRVLWSGVMRDISLVLPGELWLNGVTGTVGQAAAVEGATAPVTAATGGGLVGQVSFNGFAFDHRDVALWLSRLEDVRGFINPWLSNSTKTLVGVTEIVQFTSSVDLSEQALARSAGEEE